MNTTASVFTDKSATMPPASNPEYVRASSYNGWVSVDVHIGRGAVHINKWNDRLGHDAHDAVAHPYATVSLEGRYDPSGRADLTIYVTSDNESVETATALRDALTKAIAYARRSAK